MKVRLESGDGDFQVAGISFESNALLREFGTNLSQFRDAGAYDDLHFQVSLGREVKND